jgi:hypothetical protein
LVEYSLFTKKCASSSHYNIYILGIGFGTLLENCVVFIFGGQLVAHKLDVNQNILSWIIGSIFAITALIQLLRMGRKKDVNYRMGTKKKQKF